MTPEPHPADVDGRIAAALQLNGRASWSAIARGLGVSESTVLRRVTALHEQGRLRVIGVLDVLRCGLGVPVLVRLRCRPGTAHTVAEAIAARPQTRYATVLTGGADCAAELVLSGYHELVTLFGTDVDDADVLGVESMPVIRTFTSNHDWDPGLLSTETAQALRGGTVEPFEDRHREGAPETLDELDLAVVAALGEDGRMSFTELAGQIGASESTAKRRVDALVRRGALRFRTLAEPELFGFGVEFMVWLSVRPDRLDQAARALAAHHTTRYLSATTGSFDLVGQVALRHHGELYRYTTDVLGTLPGVRAAEITLQLHTLKRAWSPTPAPQTLREES